MSTTYERPHHPHSIKDGQKFAGETAMTVVSCSQCFISYAIPTALHKAALKWRGDRADGRGWKLCCPLGHQWWYVGENKEERLARELEYQRRRAGCLAAERDQLTASNRAQRAATTRARNQRDQIKTRTAAGVCPCCGRTFQQLARHMAAKHPDFGPDGAHD